LTQLDEQQTTGSNHRTTWPGLFLAVVAIAMAALTLTGEFVPPWGVGTAFRFLLSAAGIGGSILLIIRNPAWKPFLLIWAILQTVHLAVDVSGNLFSQGLHLGMNWSQYEAVNGTITSYFAYGFNLVGPILFCMLLLIMKKGWYPED
jgi:hypothetical protein